MIKRELTETILSRLNRGKAKFPKAFLETYDCREADVVTPDNYLDFLL